MDRSVLVIDNDDSIVEFLTVYFEMKGFTVYAALDGEAGLDLATRHRPAVILCDMRLGDMDGAEVLQRLRSRPELAGAVVIIASASSAPADIDRARGLGADDYLVKPFDPDTLLAKVEQWLKRGRRTDAGAAGPGAQKKE
jgi:two-component system, chemotaxis family, response regulator PixG